MRPSGAQINELRLGAPGLTVEQARQLGELVAKRLSEAPLAGTEPRRIATVQLRVQSRANDSLERIADEIARQVRLRLVKP